MNKLYVTYISEHEAYLCVCSDEVVYNTSFNFMRTKFTKVDDVGNTYCPYEDYKSFVVWENMKHKFGSVYPKEEFFHDMELLGFEIINEDDIVFQKFEDFKNYIKGRTVCE